MEEVLSRISETGKKRMQFMSSLIRQDKGITEYLESEKLIKRNVTLLRNVNDDAERRIKFYCSDDKEDGFIDWHKSPPGKIDDSIKHQTEKVEINGDLWAVHTYKDGSYRI